MEQLQKFILNNDHKKIIELESTEFDKYKCIAHIFLENYEKALQLSEKNSFEFCYCLYKLKKYKKCARIINKMKNKNEAMDVLLAQCLYFLGYYFASYEILSKYQTETALINLKATESLIKASLKTEKPVKYQSFCKDYESIKFLESNNKFIGEEKDEFEFNTTFENLNDEKEFVKSLENNEKNVLCANQLNNILGSFELINYDMLSKRQKEIVEINKNGGELDNLLHFQKRNYEYEIYKKVKENSFDKDFAREIKIKSENLRCLKAFLGLKRKNKKGNLIKNIKDERMKKYFEFLKGSDNINQDAVKEIINEINQY